MFSKIDKLNCSEKCWKELCNQSINRLEYLKQIGTKYYSKKLVQLTAYNNNE